MILLAVLAVEFLFKIHVEFLYLCDLLEVGLKVQDSVGVAWGLHVVEFEVLAALDVFVAGFECDWAQVLQVVRVQQLGHLVILQILVRWRLFKLFRGQVQAHVEVPQKEREREPAQPV